MKKILSLMVALTVFVFSLQAQPPGGGNPEEMRARMKERIKPMLVEKAGITEAEADKVADVYFDAQMKSRGLRQDQSLTDEDRQKKIKEINEQRDAKLKAIPLSDEKVKAVNAAYDEMRKNMQRGGGPGGQGGGRQ